MKLDVNAVGVIILTYNNYENTVASLRSVHNQCVTPRRIVLCDNGSSHEIVDRILETWEQIAEEKGIEKPVEVFDLAMSGSPLVLLRNDENLGVGAGLNHALRFLLYDHECEAFWLLHNDTIAEPYALSALIAFVDEFYEKQNEKSEPSKKDNTQTEIKEKHNDDNVNEKNENFEINHSHNTNKVQDIQTTEKESTIKENPSKTKSPDTKSPDTKSPGTKSPGTKKLGIVGSSLIYAQSSLQECAGGGKWKRLTGKTKLLDSGFERFAHSDQSEIMAKLDFINGASCLLMRDLIDTIGLFDERFILFYEDVDYGLRAKKAGYALGWAHGSVVKHHAPCGKMLTPVLTLTEEPELSDDAEYFYIRNRFYILARENPFALFFAFINLFFSSSISLYQRQKDTQNQTESLRMQKILVPFKLRFRAAFDGVKKKMDKRMR